MSEQVNYPELGDVSQQAKFYKDGDILQHPSGAIYQHIDGQWHLVAHPTGKTEEK